LHAYVPGIHVFGVGGDVDGRAFTRQRVPGSALAKNASARRRPAMTWTAFVHPHAKAKMLIESATKGSDQMPKAYWVTTYREIKDPAKLAAYAKLAPIALAPFGVRYLCRGSPDATYEAGLKERLVVSEFPSLEKAIAGHDSPGYQEALRALGDGAVRDVRIINGLE
jgi:uncharacterized protein (DUF1330 family)